MTDTPETDALPTQRAVIACGRWLATCLDLGWPKSDLDFLEALWWRGHDRLGNLRRIAPEPPVVETDAIAQLEATWRTKEIECRKVSSAGYRQKANAYKACADDLAALRRTLTTNDDARQSSPDVPGATGAPRSPQPEGSKR